MEARKALVRQAFVRPELMPAILFASIPLLLLIAITALQLLRNVPAADEALDETNATLRTIRLAHEIERAALDAERGQRGFLITGRDDYLAPFRRGQRELPGLLLEFQQAVAGHTDEQRRLLALQTNLTTKLNEMQSTIDARRAGDPVAALQIVQTDVGQIAMAAISAELNVLREGARSRLQARQALQRSLQERLTLTFIGGTVVAALALLAGAWLIGRAYLEGARTQGLLQATLDSVREGVLVLDRSGVVEASNAGMSRALGVAATDIVRGRPLPSIAVGRDPDQDLAAIVASLRSHVARDGTPALVERVDARGRTLEIFHGPAFDGGSITTFVDVSEQRSQSEVVRQAQKLEALGQMTGGVAHDFNNLLMVIIGNLSLLERSVGDDPKARRRIDLLGAAADRGARLTRQLLAFARRQPLQPEVVNIGRLMSEILPLLRGAAGAGVDVEYVDAGGLWNTTLDAAQFQAAAINLAVNARDAMPGGGKLTIDVANAALDERYAARHLDVVAGQYVAFAITDTGTGMDAQTAARAFDPFFTTKPVGEGTGLGLPQVYGFVKQSGGHVKIYSEPGEGTTVRLYFPRTHERVSGRRPAEEALRATPHGSETILVVDDDDVVRATVGALIEELGYKVMSASSGQEGLALFEAHADRIDLLFTDVVMPGGIGGRQLADRVKQIRPSLPILFTSGYTQNAIVHNGRLDTGVELLSKPYDRERLAKRLRSLLDASADIRA